MAKESCGSKTRMIPLQMLLGQDNPMPSKKRVSVGPLTDGIDDGRPYDY
jgi:hypothetical protein